MGNTDGCIRIWNYHTQEIVDFIKVSCKEVCFTKFVSRKQWFLAASSDGFISVYNYETKKLIIRFKASVGFITSVAFHPTKPYVLTAADREPIKLWNWEECRERRWECLRTFEGHTSCVNRITFSPLDTNTFASVSSDRTVKVWNITSGYPDYTFKGHSDKVNFVDYFTHGDQLFLISGSDDLTAKVWDLQQKKCVQTLKASLCPVTSVCSHPKLPVLITGSKDGSAAMWSSTDFRLQRIFNIAGYGGIIGFRCLMDTRRVLIGQRNAVSVLTMDNMEFEEAASVSFNEPQITADVSPGCMSRSGEKKSAPSELLDTEPLQLHFPSGPGKLMPCLMKLTNKTDKQLAFRLTEKTGINMHGFLKLPLYGFMQPRSTYTLVVTTEKLNERPQKSYSDVILQSSAVEYQHIYPFKSKSQYDQFFSGIEEAGKAVHEVIIRAVYGDQQGKATSEGTTNGIKILSVEEPSKSLTSLDVNQTDQWIVTCDDNRHVRILHSDTQGLVASMEDAMEEPATCVRFIVRNKWVVAGLRNGSIHVYSYENNKMQKIERINAATDMISSLAMISSLIVHPTLPFVLSTALCGSIRLWNWDKQWECTKKFDHEHSSRVSQIVFNPVDTNSFASASWDHTVKVWNLDTPSSVCTLEGHSDYVICLDYFTCDSKQYLITGAADGTAKIWDLETKMCVQTLDAFARSAVTSVCSHSSLPLLITGSQDGLVQFWSSTTFRLENVLKIGKDDDWSNPVKGLGCFKDSRRIVIGHKKTLSVIELVDEEPVAASNDQDDDEELVASRDMDDDEEPVASKDQGEQNI